MEVEKFRVGSQVRHETPEEGRRTHQPKRCEHNSIDEDSSENTLNNKSPACLYLPNSPATSKMQHKIDF